MWRLKSNMGIYIFWNSFWILFSDFLVTARIWPPNQNILSPLLLVMIKGKTLTQQWKRLVNLCCFLIKRWTTVLHLSHYVCMAVAVLRELYHYVISLWWKNKWMGWVWVVETSYSCQCQKTNKMVTCHLTVSNAVLWSFIPHYAE